MNITFDELRRIKHSLPHGSVNRIAQALNVDEQSVRNYFGANKGDGADWHLEQGPDGGIVMLSDMRIYEMAQQILTEHQAPQPS